METIGMDLSTERLKALTYDKLKVTVSLVPVVKGGRMTFDLRTAVNEKYSFLRTDDGKFFVPCLVMKQQVSKMTFADTYVYEQVRSPRDYGTYEMVPKAIPARMSCMFLEVPGRIPAFEGYFHTVYDVRRAWRVLKKHLTEKVLPLNCVRDRDAVKAIEEWDVEDYCDLDAGQEFEPKHTYSFDFEKEEDKEG